jgi:hypothetical protein
LSDSGGNFDNREVIANVGNGCIGECDDTEDYSNEDWAA